MSKSQATVIDTEAKKRILLIDDESMLTHLMRMNLEETGRYTVKEVNTSTNALTTVQDFQPDLIILDVMMPVLDGADLLYQIKNDPKTHEIPIVFHTSTVRQSDDPALRVSGFPFIPKPAKIDEMIEIIEANFKQSE